MRLLSGVKLLIFICILDLAGNVAAQGVRGFFDDLVKAVSSVPNMIKEKVENVNPVAKFEEFKNKVEDLKDKAVEKAKEIGSDIAEKGSEAMDKTKEFGSDVVQKGSQAFDKTKEIGSSIVNKGSDLIQKGTDEVKKGADMIQSKGKDIIEKGVSEIKSKGNEAISQGSKFGSSIASKGSDVFQSAKSFSTGLIEKIPIEEIKKLDPKMIMESDIANKIKGTVMDGVDSAKRLAIGQKLKDFVENPAEIGKTVRFLYDDQSFLGKLKPDKLFESAREFADMNLNPTHATSIFSKMSKATGFPDPANFTRNSIQSLRGVMSGMSLSKLSELPGKVVGESVDFLKDIPFAPPQARAIVRKVVEKGEDITAGTIKQLGQLSKGIPPDMLMKLNPSDALSAVGDLASAGLNAAQKSVLVDKIISSDQAGAATAIGFSALRNFVPMGGILTLGMDVVKNTMASDSKGEWRLPQATAMVSKFKSSQGSGGIGLGQIASMGNLVGGLLPKDLDDIVSKGSSVDDLSSALFDKEKVMSSAQIDKVVDLIKTSDGLKGGADVPVNASYIAKKGPFLPYLPPHMISKLKFDSDSIRGFQSILSTMDTSKLSMKHISIVSELMMTDVLPPASADSVNATQSLLEYSKIQQLGEFSVGMTVDRIQTLNPSAVMDSLTQLGSQSLNKGQASALLDKVEEVKKNWQCDSTVLASMGSMLNLLPANKIDRICEKELATAGSAVVRSVEQRNEKEQARLREGTLIEGENKTDKEATEDPERRTQVAHKILYAFMNVGEGKRRRRQIAGPVAVKQPTCSVLRLMGLTVSDLDASVINGLSNQDFLDCLSFLGGNSRWKPVQREQLVEKLKQAVKDRFSSPAQYSEELMLQMGVLWAAYPEMTFRTLPSISVDLLYSMGKYGVLKADQLSAGFNRWLQLTKAGDASKIGSEFAAISEFVCGLNLGQIAKLPINTIRNSMYTIGSARSCSFEQHRAYLHRLYQVFGRNIKGWEPAIVGEIGHIIGALDADSIANLTREQLNVISPVTIHALPSDFIKEMNVAQLENLSTNQVNAMTFLQLDNLSEKQKDFVYAKRTIEGVRNPLKSSQPVGGSNILRAQSLTNLLTTITAGISLLLV